MFLLRRPDDRALALILEQVRRLPLTYDPVGIARAAAPHDFHVDEERGLLGQGPDIFARAVAALRQWRQFDLGWARAYPRDTPMIIGSNVLVVARHLGFWSVNACRIVDVFGLGASDGGPPEGQSPTPGTVPGVGDCPHIAGFAYGTLSEHAETGEEVFELAFDQATRHVTYRIRAVSRERALLARLGFPIARAMQARFRRDSVAAMQRAVDDRVLADGEVSSRQGQSPG